MLNNANTHQGARLFVAPVPQNGSVQDSVQHKHVKQNVIRISTAINVYTDMPDGDCPGYTVVDSGEGRLIAPQSGPIYDGASFFTYRDGTETLTNPILGLRDIAFTDNSVPSEYYSYHKGKPTFNESTHSNTMIDIPNGTQGASLQTLLIGTPLGDTINADTIQSNVTISGQGNSDSLVGSHLDDVIFGGFIGTLPSDRIWNSTISVDTGSNTIIGGLGNDTIICGSIGDLIWGGERDNTTVHGGNDVIYTGGGKDTIYTGTGNNTIHVTDGSHSTISSGTTQALINASSGNDSILVLASGNNTIHAGDGNNSIHVQGVGKHTISSGSGNDSIRLEGTSSSSVNGGAGNNTIHVQSSGNNSITSSGVDTIILDMGTNSITLENTSTTTIQIQHEGITNIQTNGATGSITSTQSNANDTIVLSGNGTLSLNAGNGNNHITLGNAGMNNVTIGGGQDTIVITGGTNAITMSSGASSISASGGNTTLTHTSTANRNDSINVSGSATLNAQLSGGNDSVTLSDTSSVSLHLGDGANSIIAGGGQGSLTMGSGNDIVNISGTSSYYLNTGEGNNSVYIASGNGNNTIFSGSGNDTITSYSGNNAISISGGDNRIITGVGNDSITLGSGNHTITTSGGNNSIAITNSTVSLMTGGANDTLHITGNISGNIDLGGGKSDILILDSGTTIDHTNVSITNIEVIYAGSTSGNISISQTSMLNIVTSGANFYNVSVGGIQYSNQVLLSGMNSTASTVTIDVTNTDPLILGTQYIEGIGNVYIVSISAPNTSGSLMLIPSHFMDNVLISNNGDTAFTLDSLIGSRYDQSHSQYVNISIGSDHALITQGGNLHNVVAGNASASFNTHSIEDELTQSSHVLDDSDRIQDIFSDTISLESASHMSQSYSQEGFQLTQHSESSSPEHWSIVQQAIDLQDSFSQRIGDTTCGPMLLLTEADLFTPPIQESCIISSPEYNGSAIDQVFIKQDYDTSSDTHHVLMVIGTL